MTTATIIYIASCIGVIGAAVKVLWNAKQALVKPLDDMNTKLKEHEQYLENDKRRLEEISKSIDELTEAINILIKSQQTVLDHLEDGNHSGEIKADKKRLNDWLVDGRIEHGR
ncbi:MAG: hypothetical protein II489_03950 [Bacteroidaceae bacterium]|jgi:prefoldin subunit 5|nr:hypothetical protein [Bacteroidaceae bacterium]